MTAPGEVRLIGGLWKRSKLPVRKLEGLRPTPDRIRETLFNWLGQDLSGWRCLDAFAGSGALGFEAASRGASEVLLLEIDSAQAASLEVSRLRLKGDMISIQRADALAWMRRAARDRFELVFLDPPFDAQLRAPALAAALPLVVEGGFVYVESAKALNEAEDVPAGWQIWRQSRAGMVHFQLLRRSYTADAEPRSSAT
jgi:16S rRNA (guanine966-N2)-methyltransferase